MKKAKYLLKRMVSLNFKNMFDVINKVHIKTNKPKLVIFLDMVWCGLRYLAGYMDYYILGMYDLNSKQRATVLTRGKNDRNIQKFNDRRYWHLVYNKNEFNQKFDKYIKRDWLFLNDNKEEFNAFIKNKKVIIAKPQSGLGGKGIEKIKISDFKRDDLYNYLMKKELLVLEELVIQHDGINELHPNSVNTIRVITIFKNNKSHVVATYMRIGKGKIVDNFSSGGMVVPVDVKTGIINFKALDKDGNLYEKHPLTGINIIGFKVPLWEDVLNLVKQASKELPQIGIMGWDVAVTNEGPLLIEGNENPGHVIYQLPPHTKNGIGMLPTFERILRKD